MMSQKTLGDRILEVIGGALGSLIPSGVSNTMNTVVDFAGVMTVSRNRSNRGSR